MALPILAILPKVIKTAGNILGLNNVTDIVDAISNNRMSPEQRVALDNAMREHEVEMRKLDLEELRTMLSEQIAMIQSSDKYVSRARPTGLYIFYVVSAALAVGLMFGLKVDPAAILTLLAPLAGVGGTYVYRRTTEKLNGNGNGD